MFSKSAFFDFYVFLRISNHKFSKANLGYLDTFFGDMLESNLALNNFDFKCYIEFFCQTTNWTKKKGGENGTCLAKSLMELVLIDQKLSS